MKRLLLLGLLVLASTVHAHFPDDTYIAELNRRLPGGDEKIVLAVMHAINNHDWAFFKFFCQDNNPEVIADVQADAEVMKKDGVKLAEVSGTDVVDTENIDGTATVRGAQVVCVSANAKTGQAADIKGGYFLAVAFTNPDGWLKIRYVHFIDKDFTNSGILHLIP